ncbi:unnamed protein product, partial [Scytosiphon promiscuus]
RPASLGIPRCRREQPRRLPAAGPPAAIALALVFGRAWSRREMSFSSSSSSSSSSSRVIGTGEVAVVRTVNSSRRGSSSSSSSISISIDENNNDIAIQVNPLEGSPAAEQDDAEANNPNHGDDRAAPAINPGR